MSTQNIQPFQLSDSTRARFDREVAKYPADQKQSAVMACLSILQQEQGHVSAEGELAVAEYLGTKASVDGPPPAAFCKDRSVKLSANARGWNGWSPDASNARFQSSDLAGLSLDKVRNLKLKWAFGFDGDVTAFSPPTVIGNQVFVGSGSGLIHAMHADTGCLQWVFQANGPVRSSILLAEKTLLFGDMTGWFYGVAAETGKLIWKVQVETHDSTRLTGGPAVHDGVVYVPVASWEETRALNPEYQCCTFRGSVTALKVSDGSQVWKTYMIPPPKQTGKNSAGTPIFGPSGAGIWSTPTLDAKRNRLYVTTGDNYSAPATMTSDAITALDIPTGKVLWSRQTYPGDAWNSSCADGKRINCQSDDAPDYDFGSSAILAHTNTGRDLVISGQKSGVVYAVDPDKNGEKIGRAHV